MEIIYNEDGSIDLEESRREAAEAEYDSDVRGRADISDEPGPSKLATDELGGVKSPLEHKLEGDERRLKWTEPHSYKGGEVLHTCPICGTNFKGKTNKKYCCTGCRKIAENRRYQAKKRELRNFKPYRGKAGEVYFIAEVEGREVITFVPAFYGDSRKRASEYIKENYPEDKTDDYIEQIKEVIRKK